MVNVESAGGALPRLKDGARVEIVCSWKGPPRRGEDSKIYAKTKFSELPLVVCFSHQETPQVDGCVRGASLSAPLTQSSLLIGDLLSVADLHQRACYEWRWRGFTASLNGWDDYAFHGEDVARDLTQLLIFDMRLDEEHPERMILTVQHSVGRTRWEGVTSFPYTVTYQASATVPLGALKPFLHAATEYNT